MITVDFSKRGNSGLCDFLYHSIKNQISDGILKANEKLPSKRSLSEHLGISVITVQNAYAQLISEGYIYSVEKKGFFVTDISVEQVSSPKDKKEIPDETHTENPQLQASSPQNSSRPKNNPAAEKNSSWFCDFSSNATSSQSFPFTKWAQLMRQVLNSQDQLLLQKQDVHGALCLRQAIARHLSEFRNMKVIPEQIVIGAGTESLYSMIVQFLGHQQLYAVENPGFKKASAIFSLNGARTVPVEIDSQGINISALEKAGADVVHVSPAHHFPTGIVMPIRRRLELLYWANQNENRFIIEDDYDSEFRFNGKPLQTLQSADQNSKVIYINTFSKTLSPSFRLSYMILPLSLLEKFHQQLGFFACPVSSFEQFTLARFIEQGFYEKHLIKMKNYYRNLRNVLIFTLQKSSLSKISTIHEEEAGLHFLLTINTKASSAELKNALNNQQIKIPSLSDFYYETSDNQKNSQVPENTFVINYSAIQKNQIGQIVLRMENAIKSLQDK